ncbi:hypothetical protein [Paraferrimonas sp. SM1919]|uniref:hypothetical protein n=1 Tax=Paraferrimonas sp. SM1919 TaxID=2662263 RepID=UPI001F08C2E1|nr:hypothetical protein [Paraferrimonas sp. SM1919]
MNKTHLIGALGAPFLLLLTTSVLANNAPSKPVIEINQETQTNDLVGVPFVFASEEMSFTMGAALIAKEVGQKQASAIAIAMYSSNDSYAAYTAFNHYQLPKLNNWLFSAEYYAGHFTRGRYYVDGAPGFHNEIAGTNESSFENRIQTVGDERMFRVKSEYVLAIGDGANGAIASLYQQKHAALGWNPLKNGVTSLGINLYGESQHLKAYANPFYQDKTLAAEIELSWDNRDSKSHTTRGGKTHFRVTRDFGSSERNQWTKWEWQQSLFVPLGGNGFAEQQVLAFNAYLADTPTWNSGGVPPSFAGVRLGGFERLRGFSSNRYHGRSAINYAMEYRVLPEWQPLGNWPIFNLYDFAWWQWVAFAEVGRVANEFDLGTLHKNMQWTLGAGARFKVEGVVVRAEFAQSKEDNQFWIMINQPY